MSFEIKDATRQGVKPLIGLYSESGCGKTYSSLLLARGFVGPKGKIILIDSESGRGSVYADVLPGGYKVIDLTEPFTPMRYIEALRAAEEAKADIVVVDSVSHEWSGIGGVLDMASENEHNSGKQGLHNWNKPKMEHNKMLARLLQSPVPMIVCMRAKYKTRQVKVDGKTQIIKDEVTTPIQEDTFIFELLAHMELLQNHTVIVTKCSHPTLRDAFPKDKDGMITVAHGEALARWCQAAGAPATQKQTEKKADDPRKAKAAELWKLLKTVRGEDNNWIGAESWLVGHKILTDKQSVLDLTIEELTEAINKSKIVLEEPAA